MFPGLYVRERSDCGLSSPFSRVKSFFFVLPHWNTLVSEGDNYTWQCLRVGED